jgi:hypothetical protein
MSRCRVAPGLSDARARQSSVAASRQSAAVVRPRTRRRTNRRKLHECVSQRSSSRATGSHSTPRRAAPMTPTKPPGPGSQPIASPPRRSTVPMTSVSTRSRGQPPARRLQRAWWKSRNLRPGRPLRRRLQSSEKLNRSILRSSRLARPPGKRGTTRLDQSPEGPPSSDGRPSTRCRTMRQAARRRSSIRSMSLAMRSDSAPRRAAPMTPMMPPGPGSHPIARPPSSRMIPTARVRIRSSDRSPRRSLRA